MIRVDRVWPPLAADHPIVVEGFKCALCFEPFRAGDATVAVSKDPAVVEGRNEQVGVGHLLCARAYNLGWSHAKGGAS